MTRPWLVLAHLTALAAALPGCFDSHGMPPGSTDTGPSVPDAGMCRALSGSAMELRCELRGDVGHAILSTVPSRCCSSGTPHTEVTSLGTSTGTSHSIEISWTACDCCDACRCVGPIEEVDVSLGTLGPGFHTVIAGGLSCTIEHFPPVSTCRPATGVEARFSRYLFDDQPFAATVSARSLGGCGCAPALASAVPTSVDLASVTLCDCCDVCDCIDGGYEVSVDLGPLPLGDHSVIIPHGAAMATVVERSSTHPIEPPASLRIVPPDPSVVSAGPPIWWVALTGTEVVCCVRPAPVVDRGVGPAGEIALSIASANNLDCECVGAPVAFEAWFPLLELGSGEHVVWAGALEVTFVVP